MRLYQSMDLRIWCQRLLSTLSFRWAFLRSDIRQLSIVAEVFFFGLIWPDLANVNPGAISDESV